MSKLFAYKGSLHRFVPILRRMITTTSEISETTTSTPDSEAAGRSIVAHQVEVNGVPLHYERAGHGRHLVLLLPGALGSSRTDFSYQLENLNRDLFTLIAWDPRGYGKSRPPERSWPPNYLERDAEDALKLMEEIPKVEQNLGETKYSLLGWSDGGITAMIMAARKPQIIHKLVVWGANAYISTEDCHLYEKVRDINKWSVGMRKRFMDLYGEEYFRKHWEKWIDTFIGYTKHSHGDICKSDLPKILCPTLIIHGAKDALVPQEHADHLLKNISHSRLHIMAEGKHNLHMKYFKEFNSLVEQFLLE